MEVLTTCFVFGKDHEIVLHINSCYLPITVFQWNASSSVSTNVGNECQRTVHKCQYFSLKMTYLRWCEVIRHRIRLW